MKNTEAPKLVLVVSRKKTRDNAYVKVFFIYKSSQYIISKLQDSGVYTVIAAVAHYQIYVADPLSF